MEQKLISQFYHEHPLILTKTVSSLRNPNCNGCHKPVANLEMAYICMQEGCNDGYILHKKCGELPNQISHPQHSEHPLDLFYFNMSNDYEHEACDPCGRYIRQQFGYRCSNCNFNVDIKCAEASIEEKRELQHPSHPHHSLALFRKPRFSFRCDGCGDQDADTAYACSTCEFLLHKRCASLPDILHIDSRHHHPLSLIFSLPKKHHKYMYRCDVCSKFCDASRWAYFCGECRYIVHIKCAIVVSSTPKPDVSNSGDADRDVIEFPLHANDISDKLITPFVTRETTTKGVDDTTSSTRTGTCGDPSFLLEYYHKHPLDLVSEFTHKDGDREEDEEDKEEELKICDVCVTPISSLPYYQCNVYACTYFIHSICSTLSHTLQYSSSSSNPDPLLLVLGECKKPSTNHNFTLYKSKGKFHKDDILYWYCDMCNLPTNGMGYECGDCGKKIDVKCASLPTTIRHLSHTRCHREPLALTSIPINDARRKLCHGCNRGFYYYSRLAYCCNNDHCDFALHLRCAMLPLSVTNREWDKHPLMLAMSDASHDHPSDFFCEFCENEMHPKSWMYHCRRCDASFHLYCLDTGSGAYRNMKLGGRYEMDKIHPCNHPLTLTCVTLKKRCDACGTYVYTWLGFECASCYYVVCIDCGVEKLRKNLR